MYTAIEGLSARDIGAAHLMLHLRDGEKPDFECPYCKRPQHEEKLARERRNLASGRRPNRKRQLAAAA